MAAASTTASAEMNFGLAFMRLSGCPAVLWERFPERYRSKCLATGERGRERVCRDAREGEKLKQTPARQNPNASLRWHYPDQVQRVFLTRDARSIPTDRKRCAAQDPRVSSRYVTPRRGVLATVCNTSSWARGASCIMASTAFPGYPGTRA